jgi:ketosteroid isomerase-like protein
MTTDTMADADTGVVRSVFAAFAAGDLAAIGDLFHPDPTWNHRNQDHPGRPAPGHRRDHRIPGESAQLTSGTLRPAPQSFLADGWPRPRPGQRPAPGWPLVRHPQIALFTLDAGKVHSVDQFVGDPAAVTAFWA